MSWFGTRSSMVQNPFASNAQQTSPVADEGSLEAYP